MQQYFNRGLYITISHRSEFDSWWSRVDVVHQTQSAIWRNRSGSVLSRFKRAHCIWPCIWLFQLDVCYCTEDSPKNLKLQIKNNILLFFVGSRVQNWKVISHSVLFFINLLLYPDRI